MYSAQITVTRQAESLADAMNPGNVVGTMQVTGKTLAEINERAKRALDIITEEGIG